MVVATTSMLRHALQSNSLSENNRLRSAGRMSSQATCHASLRAHVGPPSKRIMTTGGRHDPSESSDSDVRPTQGADDGVRGTSVGKRFRIWMRRRRVGRALSTPRPCRPADINAWRPTKRRAPVRAAKIGESARSCCEPETRSGLSGARWAASDTSATIRLSYPLTWGQGNSPFSFEAMDSS